MDRRAFLVWTARVTAAAALGGLAAAIDNVARLASVPPSGTARPLSGAGASSVGGPAAEPDRPISPGQAAAAGGESASGAAGKVGGATGHGPAAPGGGSRPGPRDSTIARENARAGDARWQAPADAGGLGAYLDRASAEPGERVALHTAPGMPVDVEWYRLGWYGGAGGRVVRSDRGVGWPALFGRPGRDVRSQSLGWRPSLDPRSGLIEAAWQPAIEISIGEDWVSGVYVAVVRPLVGSTGYAPFIVRAPSSSAGVAPILFVGASLTWQAYNAWGGKSLYSFNSGGQSTDSGTRAASMVSFDRPYDEGHGAGLLLRWEYQFVRWLEREGREVEYAADVDLELHPEVLAGRRLIVFAGHPEYWSRPMREALQGAIDAGTNVAFFSANEIYWQVRLESSATGPARRMTCYRSARLDPIAASDPPIATCRWREAPVSQPEAGLIGQMYGHVVARPADWVVTGSNHWLYEGTGLRDGDRIANLVGQEYDTYFPALAPAGTRLLARSPVRATGPAPGEPGDLPSPSVHTATIYTAPSGATVFAAGTFQWSWALDAWGPRAYHGVVTPIDARVGQMTRNLLSRLGDRAA